MSAAAQPIQPAVPIQISAGRIFLVGKDEAPAPLVHPWEERHCPECGRLDPHHEKSCWLRLVE